LRRTIIILMVIGLGAGLLWLRPFPAAEAAVAALTGDDVVTVTATSDLITFIPSKPTYIGLIFYPGARVEPRAYAVLMRALAARGTAIFIIKLPYDIAFFAQDRATAIIDAHPEIRTWAVGGHSLGGVVASSYAAAHTDRVAGLLLYASYPASDLSAQLANTAVLSISGTNDGLATPEKIEQSRALLPASTHYVAITGSVHAFFGDYGAQPGDGQPTVSRAEAQAAIINASAEFLAALTQR
jgi:predicted alpha/beta-hydrolase family hydrolase